MMFIIVFNIFSIKFHDMRHSIIYPVHVLLPVICMAQTRNIAGTFAGFPTITFNADSTFTYTSMEKP